jgi:hypothetical protein
MEEFTIRSVSLKLIFPEGNGGNDVVAWCMAYSDTEYTDQAVISGDPTRLQML